MGLTIKANFQIFVMGITSFLTQFFTVFPSKHTRLRVIIKKHFEPFLR